MGSMAMICSGRNSARLTTEKGKSQLRVSNLNDYSAYTPAEKPKSSCS